MQVEGKWSDMQTRGFVVLRNVISADLLAAAEEDARAKGAKQSGMYGAMSLAASSVEKAFQARLQEALAQIRQNTDLQPTEFQPLSWYFARATEQWHTDPPAYWAFQNFYQYLNFWIPIVKPRADRTGLSLVPMDVLAEKAPKVFEALYRRGAALFIPASIAAKGERAIIDHLDLRNEPTAEEKAALEAEQAAHPALVIEIEGRMRVVPMDVDILELAVTPDVVPGDMIIARGDVLHKGQDNETQRVALSIRAVDGSLQVRKSFFLGFSEHARLRLASPGHPLGKKMLGAFAFYGRDVISASEVIKFMFAVDSKDEAALKVVADITPRIPELLGLQDFKAGKDLFGAIEK